MSNWLKSAGIAALTLCAALAVNAAGVAPLNTDGIGRPATADEIHAWNIDVRPDFQGLPKGSGSVAKGQDVWEGKCASCHGVFGESGEVFSPLVGGTTKDDVKTGHVKRLLDTGFPARTAMMKLSTVSTLWDFINRAMPWTAPKSLSTEEVYAVTAYILASGHVIAPDAVLDPATLPKVEMPNRQGFYRDPRPTP